MHEELARLLTTQHAISRRDHPTLANQIRRALASREIVPLLPGTYALAPTLQARATAVSLWDPDAVITGRAAAHLTWWPELSAKTLTGISRRELKRDVPDVTLVRRSVDPELVHEVGGLRFAHPAWNALELTDELGGDPIDEILRRRVMPLRALWWALDRMPKRKGNKMRRRLLIESRDEPWSALERQAHGLLRSSGITGWVTNHPILLEGSLSYLDLVFRRERVAIELDGWAFHSSLESFHSDRSRDLRLTRNGWTVLRFTDRTMGELVDTVRECLRMRRITLAA